MRVLLIEPQYRKSKGTAAEKSHDEESLWYPPLGLLKLARYHKNRGDVVEYYSSDDPRLKTMMEVEFEVRGEAQQDMLSALPREIEPIGRVYISTLFTYHYEHVAKTIKMFTGKNRFSPLVSQGKIVLGGVLATLYGDELVKDYNVIVFKGLLRSSHALEMKILERKGFLPPQGEDVDIDALAPDYSVLRDYDEIAPDKPQVARRRRYAVHDSLYAYTSRGCVRRCAWCAVHKIEPEYNDYIDIRPLVRGMRAEYGGERSSYSRLKLMDNNVLASSRLKEIISNLEELGFGRDVTTPSKGAKPSIDFNQGLDARYINDKNIKLLARLNIRPLRIAFDSVKDEEHYRRAVDLAFSHGFSEISNYMLYNFFTVGEGGIAHSIDSPLDLYHRIQVNIDLNKKWRIIQTESGPKNSKGIYSYPMRYAPISGQVLENGRLIDEYRTRDYVPPAPVDSTDWSSEPLWTKKFVRSIEIIKSATHGAISPTADLAQRAIGADIQEFITNLYMPELYLRNRNHHEKKWGGTGDVEAFRKFMKDLFNIQRHELFVLFHETVSENRRETVHARLEEFITGYRAEKSAPRKALWKQALRFLWHGYLVLSDAATENNLKALSSRSCANAKK